MGGGSKSFEDLDYCNNEEDENDDEEEMQNARRQIKVGLSSNRLESAFTENNIRSNVHIYGDMQNQA